MATATQNLKYNIGADTSGFSKGAKEVKKGLQDLDRTTGDAKKALGNLFGIDTGKFEQYASAISGLGTKFGKMAGEGNTAMKSLLSSVGMVSGALAGISIAGAVAAFKVLKDDAEAFKQTVQGVNIELETQAYLSTYQQALRDATGAGEKTAVAFDKVKRSVGEFWAKMKETVAYGFTEGASVDWDEFDRKAEEATKDANTAAEATGKLHDLERQAAAKAVEWAKAEAQIAEYKLITRDATASLNERLEAQSKAEELIKQRYGEEADLKSRMAKLQGEINDLASSSEADEDKYYNLQLQSEAATTRQSNALREMLESRKMLSQLAQKEAEAVALAAQKTAEMKASREALAAFAAEGRSLLDSTSESTTGSLETSVVGEMAIKVKPVVDEQDVMDISSQIASLMEESLASMGVTIGELIGDLATGGDAWGNFANTAVSAFGDMAISVGKLAISAGTTVLAIKASLTSLNGYAAIAAGVALVALGAAVKAGMSNIAAGGTASASSVATSAYTYSSSSGYDVETMEVKVVGTLKASGSDLVAVLNNESKRKSHTT